MFMPVPWILTGACLVITCVNIWLLIKTRKLQDAVRKLSAPQSLVPDVDPYQYSIVHMPKSGTCPPGFYPVAHLFERNGKRILRKTSSVCSSV